jgi:hypothetical protein
LYLPLIKSSSIQSEHQQTLGTDIGALKWKKNGVKDVESHELTQRFLPDGNARHVKAPPTSSKPITLCMNHEAHKSEIFRGLETTTKNRSNKDDEESDSFRKFSNPTFKTAFPLTFLPKSINHDAAINIQH